MTPTTKLLSKLNAIMAELDYIQKDKVNSFHKYKYASEQAIKEAVHPLLVKHKVLPKFSIVSVEQVQVAYKNEKGAEATGNTTTRVRMNCQLICCESGEIFDCLFEGYGEDKADKGFYKALTGGIREFFKSTFLIPTGDDPEGGEDNTNGTQGNQPTRSASPSTKEKQAEYEQRKAVKIARLDELMQDNKIEAAEQMVKTVWAESATLMEIDLAIEELEKMARPELNKIAEIEKGLKMLFETSAGQVEYLRKISKGKIGSVVGLKQKDNANLIEPIYETIESELKDKGLI